LRNESLTTARSLPAELLNSYKGLQSQGRLLEAQQHADAAARYRRQFEELLGLQNDPDQKQ
jgi:hypothetical protein